MTVVEDTITVTDSWLEQLTISKRCWLKGLIARKEISSVISVTFIELTLSCFKIEFHIVNTLKTFSYMECYSINLTMSTSLIMIIIIALHTSSLVRTQSISMMTLQTDGSVLRICLNAEINTVWLLTIFPFDLKEILTFKTFIILITSLASIRTWKTDKTLLIISIASITVRTSVFIGFRENKSCAFHSWERGLTPSTGWFLENRNSYTSDTCEFKVIARIAFSACM